MTDARIRERLQALPPELHDLPTRFDLVRRRVQRRRRARAAGAAVAVLLAAIALPFAAQLVQNPSGQGDRAPDPASSETPNSSGRPLPGADHVVDLSAPRSAQGTGTQSVRLGPRPEGATGVSTSLTCLSAGTVKWPDGASLQCGATDDVPTTSQYLVRLETDSDELVIRADRGTAWSAETTYVRVEPTEWGINARGDSYGVANRDGEPDLTAVVATNGRGGYVYTTDLNGPSASSPADALREQADGDGATVLPVYESDGQTVVGEFALGSASAGRTQAP